VKKDVILLALVAGLLSLPGRLDAREPDPPFPPFSMPPGAGLPYPGGPSAPATGEWDRAPARRSPEQLFRDAIASIGKIVIDPGHGGYDPGIEGEKELTLTLAQKLEALYVGEGVKVVLTRTSNRYVSLTERLETVRREQPDFFLSLHVARDRFTVHGVSSRAAHLESTRIRNRITAGLGQAFGSDKVYDRQLPFYLTREVAVPGIVLEVPSDMNFLDDETRTSLFKILTFSFIDHEGKGRLPTPD